jgi:hypothetical protein
MGDLLRGATNHIRAVGHVVPRFLRRNAGG